MRSDREPKVPQSVLRAWHLTGKVASLGNGLINDTYRVDDNFVLQRINSKVFDNPQAVVQNYQKIASVLEGLIPRIIPTQKDEPFAIDQINEVWRLTEFCPGKSFNVLPRKWCFTAGLAFGEMLARLQNQMISLEPVIQHFHRFEHYTSKLENVCSKQPSLPELDKLREMRSGLGKFQSPEQIIHGDCKVDNLIFDPKSDRLCTVVDLDTVMWGQPAWDFGDLLRSIVTTGSKGRVWSSELEQRMQDGCSGFFQYYTLPSKSSIDQFAEAPVYMSLMLATRFLTDHLSGSQYFKTDFPEQNLVRAREQLNVAEWFQEHIVGLRELVSVD